MKLPATIWFVLAGWVLLAGCGGAPRRVAPPSYSSAAGTAAVARYDTDGDGAIGGVELEPAAALRAALAQIDTDGDGRLTAAEINARVQSWRDARVGLMAVRCAVTLDGVPLVGAQVVLEPEDYLGTDLRPASGVTGADGVAALSLAAEHLADPRYPGVACGWYTLRVTSPAQPLPARYHTQSTLGCEVALDAAWVYDPGELRLELASP
jgi:hypothetical protein